MRNIRIEVKARLASQENDGDDIGYVSFRVVDQNNKTVFSQYELSKPFFIFGEAPPQAQVERARVKGSRSTPPRVYPRSYLHEVGA